MIMDRPTTLGLVRVAATELERAMQQMHIPGHPRPYYTSFLVREEEAWRIQAKYGALIANTRERSRNGFVDVRVGSYRSDQMRDGGLEDNDKESESYSYVDLPFGSDLTGVRHGLWRLTDARYREAVEALLLKRSHELTFRDHYSHLRSFEKCAPCVDLAYTPPAEIDCDAWIRFVEKASQILKRYPEIKDSHVEFRADNIGRIFVNSEGSRQVQCQSTWSIECYLWLLSSKGYAFPLTVKYLVTDPGELPSLRKFQQQIRAVVVKLRQVAKAPALRSFSGPTLLEAVPAGLLMHEAVGHRLEGNRLLSSGEGQTFKDSLGTRILPEFLSLRDNPTLTHHDGQSLIGHYKYDDEGVPATDALLVEEGVLKGFLGSRTGISKRHRSNGHARASFHQRPISRMGTLLVESSKGLSAPALKQLLLKEIHRQNAPFGMRIIDASSGETATDAYNFQAFLGEVNLAAKVYPDGREELVHGVNFVGTPLNAIRNIIGAGAHNEVDNAYCGAESGYIPVSTISPALVLSELELQSKPDAPYTQYSYSLPWMRK
jgi:TldD protein